MQPLKSYIVLLLLLAVGAACAQGGPKKRTEMEDGDEHFDNQNFLMAIPIYKHELKKDPDNKLVKLKLGICYVNTRVNRDLAVTYLEQYSKEAKSDEEVWFYLGRAYQLSNRLAEAISAFQKFKELKPKRADEANRQIRYCENAIELMRQPSNVTFQNLGKEINSDEPDYLPFITRNESMMVFTSRRKDNIGGKKVEVDGYRSSDIYLSTAKNGKWTTAKNAGRNINTGLDEQVVGLRADGQEMYIYLDHIDKFGDIYVSTRKDTSTEFPKARIFLPSVNDKFETSGCLNEDGTVLFFTRREKQGDQSDLYVCRKLPTGLWGIPQALPDFINTAFNEESPFLSYDGKTLYFASEGHNSMGGYDLFKTQWDQEKNTFSKPVNLGYPINSTDDDRSICVTPDNRLAYLSAFRPKGFGDLDIYRIKFNEVEQNQRIFTGRIFLGDTVLKNQPRNYAVTVIATNESDQTEYTFTPHSKTGRFVMSLPEGKYRVLVSANRYQEVEEQLEVSDLGPADVEFKKNFLLKIKY